MNLIQMNSATIIEVEPWGVNWQVMLLLIILSLIQTAKLEIDLAKLKFRLKNFKLRKNVGGVRTCNGY